MFGLETLCCSKTWSPGSSQVLLIFSHTAFYAICPLNLASPGPSYKPYAICPPVSLHNHDEPDEVVLLLAI